MAVGEGWVKIGWVEKVGFGRLLSCRLFCAFLFIPLSLLIFIFG